MKTHANLDNSKRTLCGERLPGKRGIYSLAPEDIRTPPFTGVKTEADVSCQLCRNSTVWAGWAKLGTTNHEEVTA